MQSNYNIGHELETVTAMEPDSYAEEATLQNDAAHTPSRGMPASVVAEDDELDGSLKHVAHFLIHQGRSPAIPGANSASASHPIAILQPALPRSARAQSGQTLVFHNNRSMSDLVNNPTDNGTLEYGRAGGYRGRMRPSAMQHYRNGRYRAALMGFMSRQRMYISIVTFVVMFGMTVAGLWLEIAGSHLALVEARPVLEGGK